MADITVTGAADFTSVTAGLKKMASESTKLEASSKRSGMAVLELSRGIEDFAVAGVRGAMNNIPGMLMSFGAGAGLAGVASLAAVGVTTLTKVIDGLMDKAQAVKEADLAKGIFRVDHIEEAEKAMQRGVEKAAKAMAAMRDLQGESTERQTHRTDLLALGEEYSKLKIATEEFRSPFDDESTKQIRKLGEEIKLVEEASKSMWANLADQKQVPGQIEKQIAERQKDVDAYNKLMADIAEGAKTAELVGLKKPVSETMWGANANGVYPVGPRDPNEVAAERQANAAAARKAFDESVVAERNAAAEKAGAAKSEIADLEAKLKASKEITKEQEREARIQGKVKEIAKEMVNLKRDAATIAGMSSAENFFPGLPSLSDIRAISDLIASMDEQWSQAASKMRIDGSGMLSSSGRIGGSGVEFQASVATINYQREAINNLKKIERNTRNRTSTYN